MSDQDMWLLEYTEPGDAWAKATKVMYRREDVKRCQRLSPRMTHGSITASGNFACPTTSLTWAIGNMPIQLLQGKVVGKPSALTDYHHGPPTAAPTGLTAYDAGPDARRLVWDEIDGLTYELRSTADPTDDDEWTDWEEESSGVVVQSLS